MLFFFWGGGERERERKRERERDGWRVGCKYSRINKVETVSYLSSWFFAAAMANLRPQNLPLSAIYCKFYYFS